MQAVEQNKKFCSGAEGRSGKKLQGKNGSKGICQDYKKRRKTRGNRIKLQPLKANVTRALPVGSKVETCDNSGAKIIRIFTVVGLKTTKGRIGSCGVGDIVQASVVSGKPDMRKQVVH